MGAFFRRLTYWLRQRELDTALQEELEFHRALKQQELESAGLSSTEAHFAARREIGNLTRAREESRAVWIWPWLDETWQDVRYAARGLISTPSFTLPALAILVVTMGLTTTLYALVDSLLLRPWHVADPDAVVALTARRVDNGDVRHATSHAEYRYLAEHSTSLELVAFSSQNRRVEGVPDSADPHAQVVSGNYFHVLGVPIAAGRPLNPADDVPGRADAVAVVDFGLAQRRFGGVTRALGAVIRIGDVPFTIVGVAAPGANDQVRGIASDVWLTFHALRFFKTLTPGLDQFTEGFLHDPDGCCVTIAGRLGDVTRKAAEAELDVLAAQFAAAHGIRPADISLRGTARVHSPNARGERNLALLFSLAIVLILLLGCANVGNLVLARALSRRGDVTVRLWLGATRGRLVRHLLSETLILAAVGGLASLAVARYAIPVILQRTMPWTLQLVSIDGRTATFAFGLAIVVAALSGTLPALKATRIGPGMRVVGRIPIRLRNGLLAFQMAASLVLLVGAALLARGILYASGEALGLSVDGKVAVGLGIPFRTYTTRELEQISARVVEAVEREGLGPVGGAEFVPLATYRLSRHIRLPGATAPSGRAFSRQAVTPGFFDVLEIPRRQGRIFDRHSEPDDVVVEEAFAQILWPDSVALGRVFLDLERPDGRQEKRVIGVVANARTQRFDQRFPTYYERAAITPVLIVRDSPNVVRRVQHLIRAEAPAARPVIRDLASNLRGQVSGATIGAVAGAGVAAIALLLAAIGTLGVCRYVVNERIPEIGVRTALGATPRDVVRLVLRGMATPLAGGLVAGLLGAQALGALLGENLYGISPRDPLAYGVVLIVMATVIFLALVGPTRRAVRVDPASMLRTE